MDTLLKFGSLTDDKIMDFIEANVSDFRAYSEKDRQVTYERVKQYLKLRQFSAKTFDEYGLRGTPSAILIDKNGILRHSTFGSDGSLEGAIKYLLDK
jgi:hypothetical protein